MKNIVLILFVIFFGLNLNAQSLQSFGLKGKVKSIQEELKMCSNKYGKAQDKDCSVLTSEKQFTEKGYLLEYKDSFKIEGITREKVETPTGWLETVYNTEDGLKIKIGEDYYNKENLITKTFFVNENGAVNRVKEYFYDGKGIKTKTEEVAYIDDVKEKTIFFYNGYGSFSGFEIYRDEVLSDQGKFDIMYEFDEKGNWVQSIVITEFSTDIHNRTITYY